MAGSPVAARIFPRLRAHAGKCEQILRALLHRHVSGAPVDRTQTGFSVLVAIGFARPADLPGGLAISPAFATTAMGGLLMFPT